MTEEEIIVVKSPIVPSQKEAEPITHDNQVTYSVRLANGMIVTRPEEFPNDLTEQADLSDIEEDTE